MKIKGAVLHKTGAVPPYAETKPLSIEEVDLDPPGQGEVLIKIGAARPLPFRLIDDQWCHPSADAYAAGPRSGRHCGRTRPWCG